MRSLLGRQFLCHTFLAVVLTAGLAVRTTRAGAKVESAPDVDAMILRAKALLYSQQHAGNWEPGGLSVKQGTQATGWTALVTYALLETGEHQKDPRIDAALSYLVTHKTLGTYALGLRCLVWGAIDLQGNYREAARKDAAQLLGNIRTVGDASGLYFYTPPTALDAGQYDLSASQFAPLGLAAVIRQGIEVPNSFWKISNIAYRRQQFSDGGFAYNRVLKKDDIDGATFSMTAAGTASLLITRQFIPTQEGDDSHIANGVAWLGSHFMTGYKTGYPTYSLFAASRVGVLSGLKRFGDVDWYKVGLDYLAKTQQEDGGWSESSHLNCPPPAETGLALLFLGYGSAPVAINKLRYTDGAQKGKQIEGHWNKCGQDALHFTQWMGSQIEQRLNWQVVDLDSVDQGDLHDAPILLITGDKAISFDDEQKERLRQFIEEGGLIWGNAIANSEAFSKSFLKLGEALWPGSEFRQLSVDHPIFTDDPFRGAKAELRPKLMGLSNGVRELMILPQQDACSAFQRNDDRDKLPLYQVAEDMVLYTKEFEGFQKKKQGNYTAVVDPAVTASRTVRLVRLQYGGNWDPEPGGWKRLKAVLHNEAQITLDVQTAVLGEGKLAGARGAIAHLTGTDQFKLNNKQMSELKEFIKSGGTIIIDAAGGSSLFAGSADAVLDQLLGQDSTTAQAHPLLPDDPLYTIRNHAIASIRYRSFSSTRLGRNVKTPRIYGFVQDKRVVVYFSREDLSAGLVGETMGGIYGYSPDSATCLMRNIILACALPDPAMLHDEAAENALGNWTPTTVSIDSKTLEWRVTPLQLKTMKGISFQYTGGSSRLDIDWASVVADGKEIARDEHAGFAGTPSSQNVYRFQIPDVARDSHNCVVRASVHCNSAPDSSGTVTVVKEKE